MVIGMFALSLTICETFTKWNKMPKVWPWKLKLRQGGDIPHKATFNFEWKSNVTQAHDSCFAEVVNLAKLKKN